MKRPILVSIEGNIGAGKSTVLENMELYFKNDKVLFLKEPVDLWEQFKDASGKTILEKFYGDQRRYGFTFQVMAYITRLSLLKNAIADNPDVDVIIIERSLCADKNIFMNMLHDDGIVEDMEYNIYNKWYDEFIRDYRVDAVIYMDSNPEVCQRRIAKRCRQGEEGIPLNYLSKCRDYHSKWLLHNCNNHVVIDEHIELHRINHEGYTYPVLHVNSNVDTIYEPTNYESSCVGNMWLKTIRDFIYTLPNH